MVNVLCDIVFVSIMFLTSISLAMKLWLLWLFVSPKVVFIFLSERNMNSFISGVDSLSSMYLLQVCF